MYKEIVVIPTYKRDELLWLALEAIRRQYQGEIAVFCDHAWRSLDLLATCERFDAPFHCLIGKGYGNSWNVIRSLRFGASIEGIEIVHLIEDDTILHDGYFEWARLALSNKAIAAVNGRVPQDPTTTWYESPCASWNIAQLRQALEKVPLGYFAETREEMQAVLDRAFPNSHYIYGSAEQDGFFLRCIEFFKWKTKFPEKALASHIGFFSDGYNQPRRGPDGTFEERIAFCRALLYDRQRRMEFFGQRITDSEMEGLRK